MRILLSKSCVVSQEVCTISELTALQGYTPQSKTDRRFFAARLGDLIKEGTIEKVLLPNDNLKAAATVVAYIRLATEETSITPLVNPQAVGDDKEDPDDFPDGDLISRCCRWCLIIFVENEPENGLKTMSTLHRQIVDLLDEAGTKGVTMSVCGLVLYLNVCA